MEPWEWKEDVINSSCFDTNVFVNANSTADHTWSWSGAQKVGSYMHPSYQSKKELQRLGFHLPTLHLYRETSGTTAISKLLNDLNAPWEFVLFCFGFTYEN